jgi:hypothetical protein
MRLQKLFNSSQVEVVPRLSLTTCWMSSAITRRVNMATTPQLRKFRTPPKSGSKEAFVYVEKIPKSRTGGGGARRAAALRKALLKRSFVVRSHRRPACHRLVRGPDWARSGLLIRISIFPMRLITEHPAPSGPLAWTIAGAAPQKRTGRSFRGDWAWPTSTKTSLGFTSVSFSRSPAKPCFVFSGLRRFENSPRSSSFADNVYTEPTHSSRCSAQSFHESNKSVELVHAFALRSQHSFSHSPRRSWLSR